MKNKLKLFKSKITFGRHEVPPANEPTVVFHPPKPVDKPTPKQRTPQDFRTSFEKAQDELMQTYASRYKQNELYPEVIFAPKPAKRSTTPPYTQFKIPQPNAL